MFLSWIVMFPACRGAKRLRFRSRATLGFAAALAALGPFGCSSGPTDFAGNETGPGHDDLSIRFDAPGTLELAPLETRRLTIVTDPQTSVRFYLVGASGDSSLDVSEVVTDDAGVGAVTLVAPSKASTFRLVASAGARATAEIGVAVSDNGFASIRVVPAYQGIRPVGTWHASATVSASCATILAGFPTDPEGALYASADPTEAPVVTSVPVGPTVAVAIRSRELMWGCKEVTLRDRQPLDLTVPVTDRPLDLGKVALDMELGFEPAEMDGYAGVLAASKSSVLQAVVGNDFATHFLDAVEATMDPSARAAFHEARVANGLDGSVRDALSGRGVDVATTVDGWLDGEAFNAPTSLRARLIQGAKASEIRLELESLGPVIASSVGAPPEIVWTWSTGPSDKIFLGGQIPFSNALYVSAFAAARAQNDFPAATTVADAMSELVDCTSLGPQLDPVASCAGCGVSLCEAGLSYLWTAALSGAGNSALLDVSVSATATVGDDASATSFVGTWVGGLDAADKHATLGGAAVGSTTIE